ncbi:phosphoribosylanthranilate isomerase [Cephaloticoccus primus]|uniref:phosphoribosylanthranilate isomerase n=1 Tax=Cephaloticoccus primus TaxID=1548207 RepID=UPI0009ECF472|nr:phosphoribosylanthranilate isomerase [Cephaloticoccus primus]
MSIAPATLSPAVAAAAAAEPFRLKVCGLTSLRDARFADQCGADYLGFILHRASPRFLAPERFFEMLPELPAQKKVAVMVEPAEELLDEVLAAGFDFFQVHFRHTVELARLRHWSAALRADRLWLAPKLPPAEDVPEAWFPLCAAVVLDTFSPDKFGGTGEVGDWQKFARHRARHPGQQWILAGGLGPQNIADAVWASGARFVDVNSGVETAPGIKDLAKLERFTAELARARAALV